MKFNKKSDDLKIFIDSFKLDHLNRFLFSGLIISRNKNLVSYKVILLIQEDKQVKWQTKKTLLLITDPV
jgi:hypothetical protein